MSENCVDDTRLKTLGMISKDMEDDAAKFDGLPFNGKNVAEYFGNQGAAIAALADIMKSLLMEKVNHPLCSHPYHPVGDWQNEVANGDTRLGYWEWADAQEEGE